MFRVEVANVGHNGSVLKFGERYVTHGERAGVCGTVRIRIQEMKVLKVWSFF